MDKIKSVRLELEDGNYSDEIPFSMDANEVIDEDNLSVSFKLNKKPYYFDNVASMKSSKLKAGDCCITLGYYKANDGGGATYQIRSKVESDVEDNGSIHFIGSNFVAELIKEKEINILQYGCKKDGKSDCSVIIQSIINNASDGDTIYFPNGNYLFNSTIKMKDNINIKGSFKNKYNISNGASRLYFNNVDGFTKGINQVGCNYFEGLVIVGKNKTGVAFKNLKLKMHRCSISEFAGAISSISEGVIDECEIFKNTTGISLLVDSKLINNFIYNNNTGINLGKGANDNIVTNNKIEWNNGQGILLYQNNHNIISNNIIDRSTSFGLEVNNCSYITVSANVFKRNFIDNTIGDNHSHIKVENSNHCSFIGNITRSGNTQDDGTGVVVPYASIYITTSSNLIFVGNDFTGSVAKDVVKYNNPDGNINEINLGYNILNSLKGILKDVTLLNGTGNVTFNCNTPGHNSVPSIVKFGIFTRKTDNSSGNYKEIIASIYNKYNSSLIVTLSETNIDGTITASGSFTNGVLTITFTNAENKNIKVQELYY